MEKTVEKHVVKIGDEVYTLLADEPESVVRAAVTQVDELMSTIALHSSVVDKKKIAVLSALQMAIALEQAKAKLAKLESQQQALVAAIDSACTQVLE